MQVRLFYKLVAFMLLGNTVFTNAQQLIYISKQGTEATKPIANLRSITFNGGNLAFNMKDQSVGIYPLMSIKNLHFGGLTNSIKTIKKSDDHLIIYPNPATDKLYFKTNKKSFEITLMSIDGKTIQSKQAISNDNYIDISHLAKGVYILKLDQTVQKFYKR